MTNELTKEWSLGYILDHWIRVIAIAVLVFTGIYIHTPFIAGGPDSTIMASMRFFHFLSAYALILGLVIRIYMAFKSTFDADWKDFSITENLKNVPDILSYYLFIKGSHKDYRRYNPLLALAYLVTALVIIFTVLTGGALYHGKLFGILTCPGSFRWVSTMLGGESYTRIWHILAMWYFIIFVLIHMYLAISISLINKDRTFTSIFTGYKVKKH
jgi:Ni/Fe-hydrogenase 1 B-type cytochrome subunit